MQIVVLRAVVRRATSVRHMAGRGRILLLLLLLLLVLIVLAWDDGGVGTTAQVRSVTSCL